MQALYTEAASRTTAQDNSPALTKLGVGLVSLLTRVERELEPTKDCAEDCMSCGCHLSVSHHSISTAAQRDQARSSSWQGIVLHQHSARLVICSCTELRGTGMDGTHCNLYSVRNTTSGKTTAWRRFVKPIIRKVCLQLPDSVPS